MVMFLRKDLVGRAPLLNWYLSLGGVGLGWCCSEAAQCSLGKTWAVSLALKRRDPLPGAPPSLPHSALPQPRKSSLPTAPSGREEQWPG